MDNAYVTIPAVAIVLILALWYELWVWFDVKSPRQLVKSRKKKKNA